jgi:cold shock protein
VYTNLSHYPDYKALRSNVERRKVMTEEVAKVKVRGTCKWFNATKGYGFLVQEDKSAKDVFVHYSQLQGDGYKSLKEGDVVEFNVIQGEKGLQAQEVSVVKE